MSDINEMSVVEYEIIGIMIVREAQEKQKNQNQF